MLYRRLVHEFPEQLYSPGSHDESFPEWLDRLRGGKELVLEIGCGTGDFLCSQALKHPELFFLGLEMKPDRAYKGYHKANELGLQNIAFFQTEAIRIPEFHFPRVKKIYLFFSDPWPKKRHMIRRLTSELYLPMYEELLEKDGQLIVKTDNQKLFEYSIMSLKSRHWKILEQDHHFVTPADEQTQYEKRFLSEQKPIFYLRATHPSGKD
ncbi:MAG: tRNA (guanosine(46)-N7)-methyltransferase TrmB [Candidatus Altimarinota bacterium]